MKYNIMVIAFLLSANVMAQEVSNQFILTNSSNIQKEDEKIEWKTYHYTLIDSVSLEDHDIFYPHALTVNNALDIALMAWNKREMYVFKSGDLLNSIQISTRKGRGPGEYEGPFDMYLTDQGLLWISDIDLRKVEVWDINANHLNQTFKLRNRFTKPDQIVACGSEALNDESIYVLSTQYGPGYEKKKG